MSRIHLFLIFSLMISTITPSFGASPSAQRLTELKKSVTQNVHQFVKCVKGDKDCSLTAQRTARVTLALLAALALTAAGKLSVYIFKKRPSLPQRSPEEQKDLNKQFLAAATFKNNREELQSLLEKGADINAQSDTGLGSLIYAIHRNDNDTVEFLLQQPGINIEITDNNGNTPLMAASYKGYTDIVRLLIKSKANVNTKGHLGWSPLQNAAFSNNIDTAKVLLHAKALPNSTDNEGYTALNFAKTDEMKNLLRDASAKTGEELKEKK